MIKQESGYILPTTLMIIFILSAVIAEQMRHYVVEQQFLHAETKIFQAGQLLQAAVVDLKQRSHEELLATSELHYDGYGIVLCDGQEIDEQTVKIILQAYANNGGVRYAHVHINTSAGVATEWWEVTR